MAAPAEAFAFPEEGWVMTNDNDLHHGLLPKHDYDPPYQYEEAWFVLKEKTFSADPVFLLFFLQRKNIVTELFDDII